jgi:hypothetical protein
MKLKILLIGLIFSLNSFADFKEMSERLIRIRQEIELINTDLDSLQKTQNSQLESLLSRRAELEIQLKKERLKGFQLKEKKLALKNKITPKKGMIPKERELVLDWHKNLTSWLNASLPYKNEERNLELEKIKELINKNSSFHEIIGQLWRFSEKQIELVRHNKFEVVNLEVAGEKTTAELARVGLITFAFKLPSEEVGFAKKVGGKWTLDIADQKDEATAAKRLISKFKEKKYSGLFDLPIAEL